MRSILTVVTLTAVVAAVVLTVHAQQGTAASNMLEGSKPYTPTRLEWLAVELNAKHRTDQLRSNGYGYSICFVPLAKEETILIAVAYSAHETNRELMNISVDSAREMVEMTAKARGWDGWLKIREQVKRLGQSR